MAFMIVPQREPKTAKPTGRLIIISDDRTGNVLRFSDGEVSFNDRKGAENCLKALDEKGLEAVRAIVADATARNRPAQQPR